MSVLKNSAGGIENDTLHGRSIRGQRCCQKEDALEHFQHNGERQEIASAVSFIERSLCPCSSFSKVNS